MANPPNDDGHLVQNFRPTSASVSLLRIGRYQIRSQNKTRMTARWYYARKELNWEILEDNWKKKIKIDWSNISAIRVDYGGDPKTLEIELRMPPNFYGEAELRLRRDPRWQAISDFTGGEASTYRIHHLQFSNNTPLERNMEPLLILDSCGRPFSESPLFVRYIADAPQAPLPLMNSQLLQHHQIPPDHSSVPTCSSNSNLVRESANRLSPSLQDSHVSDDGNLQPSSSSGTIILHVEPKVGHSADNAPSSSNDPDNRRHGHEGYQHDNCPNMTMASDDPSCMRAHTRDNQAIFNQVDMDRRSGSSYYPMADDVGRLVMRTSNEPRTNDLDAQNGHDGPIDAEVVSNPHQEESSPSSIHGESHHK